MVVAKGYIKSRNSFVDNHWLTGSTRETHTLQMEEALTSDWRQQSHSQLKSGKAAGQVAMHPDLVMSIMSFFVIVTIEYP